MKAILTLVTTKGTCGFSRTAPPDSAKAETTSEHQWGLRGLCDADATELASKYGEILAISWRYLGDILAEAARQVVANVMKPLTGRFRAAMGGLTLHIWICVLGEILVENYHSTIEQRPIMLLATRFADIVAHRLSTRLRYASIASFNFLLGFFLASNASTRARRASHFTSSSGRPNGKTDALGYRHPFATSFVGCDLVYKYV